jgi:hypothetical protein
MNKRYRFSRITLAALERHPDAFATAIDNGIDALEAYANHPANRRRYLGHDLPEIAEPVIDIPLMPDTRVWWRDLPAALASLFTRKKVA